MKSKKITKRIVALVMATLVVMTGLVIVSAGATVEKNIDSWATLKTELGKLSSGAVAVFNITEKITATEELTIPSGTTVSLVCGNSNHSAATIDIQRAMAYDGHLFRVPDSATLKVQCCISGRGFSDGNWQGFFTTTNADKVTGNTMSSDKTCYGRALILNYGDVELIGSKAVLKHNYNPYSNVSDENGYLQNFHRSSGNDTVSGGWSSKQIVYPVVANSGNAMKGGAIYNKNGSLVIKKDDTGSPSIYDCIAEFGGAICHETIYSTDDLIIEEGNIYNCVSRQAGGAIYSVINTDTSSSSTGQATWLNFRIGSADGADTDISIRDNRAPQGGGVYSNIRVDMNCGTITNNEATGRFSAAKDVGVWGIAKVARGGGVYITGTSDEAVYGKPSLNLKGGVISNNKADSGAGVYASGTAGTVNMSGGKITGNQAGVLSQESLKNYRKITTVGDSAVIYPKDGSGDGIVDYYDSVRAGNFYDTDAADSYEKNFALFVLKEKYLHTFWEEKFANISTDKNLGAAADRDKLLALLNNSVDDGGLYKGNEVVDGVEYRLYKPITLYFESSSGLDVEYGSKFYNEYYIGFRANRFDNDGYYSETSSDSVVFGKYKDGAFVASKTENIFWEGPYVDDKVSFFGVEFKTSEDFVYDETQELAADELTTGSYYNSNVTSRFFTKTAITNEDLYDKYSDYIGLGGGIYSGTDVNITGGTIGGENVIGLDFKDAETLGTITNLKGNISYKAGGGIYMNGGTLTINGKSASVEGNLTDENGGGIFVQSRQSDDVDGVLKFLRGTVANNRATLNYNPASGPKAGGGSGGGIYLAMTAQPSIIGVEGTDKDAWPQIYGNECLNYGGGIHSFVKGSVKLNEASSGGYDITTPGLTINNANIYHNKTGLNFRDGLNYSSGGGVSSNGALLIKGGNISANFSNSNGAGVYCTQYRPDDSYSYSRGAFKMTGGTIENNGRWAYDYDSVELELFPGWTIPWVETTYTQVDIGGGAYSTTYGQPMVFEGTKDNIIQIVNNYANKGAGVYSNRWAHRMSVDTTDSNYSSSNDGYANYGTEFIYCNISGNTAQSYGGGVALGTSALFKNTTVSKNKALTSHGGGIRVAYDSADFIDVINTKIFENEAKSGNGGGIFNYGVVNLISGEVYDNKAGVGGGICNSSYGSGGLVYNDKIYFKVGNGSFQKKDGYSKKVFAKLNINPEALGDVKIYNNEAVSGAGGGVYFSTEGEPSTINNALIYGNKAKTYGGGICTYRSNTKTMTYPDASSNTNTVKTDVSNVVITNSNVNENKAEKGAGIYSSASSELLLNKGVSISENIASDTGGGVCLNKGSLSATEVTVSNNIAKSGAGLHITGDTNITNSYLKDNSVESGVLGNGGGININSGVTKITGGEISGNSSTQYGGGVFNNATVEISETTIEGNTATENGGGVNASNSSVSTKLTNCTISDNEAKFGGGVFEHSRSTKENGLRITGCILTENKALEDGGGLYLSHAPKSVADSLSIIENTEFTLNNAKRGAGIFNYGRFKVVGDTKIHKNTAVNYGGGLYITTGSNDIETNLVSVDFYENHAGYGGGAIDNADTLVIDSKDVLIHNNTTDNKGGGILNTGTLTLGEIVVNNNTALNQGGGIYNGGTFVADGLELLSNESGSTAAGLITFGSATIKNATIKGNNSGGHCGGIGVDAGGSLTLSDSKITENTGENGAGIYIVKSSVGSVITGCEVFNNVSSNIGGGIFIAGDTELTNTTIHDNKAAVNAGGVYWCGKDINSSTFDIPSGVKIFDNTARDAAGMYVLDGTVNLVGGEIYNNIANTSGWGGGVQIAKNATFNLVSGKVYGNSAGKGGGFYVASGTTLNTLETEVYDNAASTLGGAVYNIGTLSAKDALIYGNTAGSSGGGVYSTGTATIEGGYYYDNTNGGLYVDGGTTTIDGGYFGFSDYKSDSDYTTSRNTVAQIITGKSGTVNVTGENKTRVVASMSDGESIYTSTEHIAIKNAGVFNIAGNCEKGDFDIYGTGTGINNSGTFNADGAMRIISSVKVGETTIQNRLGVRNTGTFTLNNEDAEISYCGFRGVNNSGTFHLKEGSIHHNSTKFYPETNSSGEEISGGHGGGIVNLGSFDMSGGKIYNNSTKESGGGIITGCTNADDKEFFSSGSFKMSGGEIYSNTAGTHGGGVSVYNRTSSCEITGGKIGGSEDKANIAGDCGGGVYIGDAYSKSTETNGAINITGVAVSYNTANNGGGIYLDRGGSTKISSDNVVLSNNTALNQGGGIHIRNGETTFSQGVNVNNNTAKDGGGVYINSGAKVSFEGCVVEYNKATHTDVAKTNAGGVDNRGELVADGKDGYEVLIQYNISSNTVGGLSSGGTTTLKNVSINNNNASGTGGGIGVSGTLNIEDGARVFANTSNGMGAGILANGSGIINMTGGTVGGESSNDGNISGSSGGGLALLGSSKLNLSGGNIAYNNAKNNGGGVYVDTNASLEATKGEISNNEVQTLNGGGIYNSGTTILNGSEVVVSENTAYKIGGGVYTTSGSTFTATNCKVAENEAETGAGIYLLGEADITGVLVEKNIAGKVGGGISVGAIADGVEINLKNCDIKANELAKITGVEGAGLYFTNTKGVVNVNNCDIHENVATGSGDFAGGVLVRGNVSVVGSRVYDNYASHGAGMLLGSGIFVMKDSEVYNNGILKDENGEVTSTASQGGGIRIAKTDTKPITFENSDIHDNTARDGGGIAVTIAKDVPVNFDNKTIIRNNIAAYRGGGIYVSHTEGYETQFDIKGGKICSNTAVHGGGVNYQDGVLASNIANVEVCCNKATGNRKESGSGGGVYLATETDITITGSDTKIHDNIGEDGGGVAVSGNLEVKNGVQIYNNKVFRSSDVDTSVLAFKDGYKGGYGGGLYLYPTGKEIVLDGANIYNNYSDHQGGGILSQGTTTYIKGNTKIHNNDCPTGGGMFNNGTVVISESAEFYENTATNHAGICNNGNGNITIKGNVKIHNNTAEKNSGGIFNNGNCTLKIEENVEVYENSASTGGGIYAAGKFHLASNAKIHHNTANYGGGITISAIGDKLFEMTGGEVYENTAKYGAGIYFGTNAKNNALSGGSIYKNAASEHGGGIYLSNDTITVNITNGFEVYENTAKKGAGITVILGTLNVDNGVIRNNTTSDSGGGIWNKGVVNLTETLVYENEAKASGGGIDVLGTVNTFAKLTVVGGEIRDNFAAMNGGGVHSVYGNVSLDDCVVSGNVSEGVFVSGDKDARGGGGLFVNSGTLDLINCEISSNSAVNNGGGFYTLAKTTIENIEVFNNTAGNLGGGIAVHDAGLVNVGEHIVVHNNTASSGGGIYNTGEWYEDEDFTQETGVKVYENTATGGAIFNQKTYVSHNAEIYDNTGYGVKNERQMTIYDALVHNNSNSGIQCATNSVLAIEDSKIYSNGASSEGAGVYCTSTAKTTTITDCEIYDNVATYAGGGIRAYGTQVDVIGGKIYNNSAKSNGGAIVVGSPNCNLYGVEIFDNGKEKEYTKADGTKATISTVNGGGVYVTSNGVLNVDERTELLGSVPTKVYNHTASGAGAGIYNLGTLNVKSGMIYNNGVTNDGENGVGGGICNMGEKSKLNVTGGEIFENVAPRGAGIYVDILSQESFISDAKIHHNTYPIGGVGMGVYTLTTAGLTIRDSEVYSNSSDSDLDSETEWKQRSSGGGIANGGVLTIESTKTAGLLDASPAMKIYDNHVSSGGGGISNHTNGTVTIRGGEIYGNSAISFVPDKNGIVKGSGGGGGIANNNTLIVESGETNGTEVLIHNNLSGNAGSGIFNAGGTKTYLKVTGSKIYDNGKLKTTVDGVTKEYIGICGGGIYSAGKFEVEDAEIYNNYVTGSGGGIGVEGTYGDFNSTVTNCIIRDNYAGVQGGGIGGGVGNGSFTVKGGEVYNNSSISGGGIINSGNTKLDGVKVYNNYATDGAGVYAWSGVFEMIDTEVYENGSVDTTNGGGIYIRKNDTQPVTITNCLIKDNTAKRGGGVNVSRTKDATVNIVGTEIDNNKAYVGGGIYLYADAGEITVKDGSVISNNTTTRTTNYDPHGGGVFVAKGTTVNLNNSEVSNNSSEAYGGGAWVEGTLNLNGKNTKVDNNDAQTGGGVFIQSNGTVNMNNGIISDNSSTASAGGVWVHQNSNFNMSGGSIESNTAGTNGNGVYITGLGTFSMTGGSISGNTKTLGDKKGVYVAGATEEKVGTFEMSGDAVVANDNIVFLEKFAYISVPEEFTNDKNIRAHIDGAEMVTGRVVAKHTPEPVQATDKNGNPVVDEEGNPVYEENAFGTVALYHDAENPVMVEQYFAVNGKMLRAGNQGASKYTKENNIVNQDVFITEGYSITFDMNVPLEESLVSSEVTHTIDGVGEWTFPDGLSNRYVNENVYIKYWYEDISVENEFSRGYAEADFASFSDWNTESDGSGDIFDPDSVIEIEGSVNENITYYAQWLTQLIDINYLGNGATLGNDFTEKDVDATQDEYTLDDGVVNGKEEQNATGIDEDGKPVFERVEEVREVVTDENGDPVIDAETGEEVTVVTDTKLFSFEGWSFAERPNSENPVMDFNTNVEMREITSRLNSPNNRSLFAMFNLRNVEQADGEHENSYANIYAAWDQYPKIYAVDRYFTLEEAQAGKITLDELMNTEYTFACDGFDKDGDTIYLLDEEGKPVVDENKIKIPLWEGQNTNFYDSNEVQATDKDGNLLFDDKGDPVMVDEYIRDDAESFTILDYMAEDFTNLKGSAAKTLTFCAVDRAGNMTVKTITVYVTDNSDADASFFSRFISERYFKDAEGNFVLEENGGFNEKSNWVTKVDYVALLESVFANKKDEETSKWDKVYEIWTWDMESIKEAKQFVEDEGLGNVEQDDALAKFRARFGPVKTN